MVQSGDDEGEESFGACLSSELASLECRLVAEHGRELQSLQKKVAHLEGENSLLRQELRSLAREGAEEVWASLADDVLPVRGSLLDRCTRGSESTKFASQAKECEEGADHAATLRLEPRMSDSSLPGMPCLDGDSFQAHCPPGVPSPEGEPALLKAGAATMPVGGAIPFCSTAWSLRSHASAPAGPTERWERCSSLPPRLTEKRQSQSSRGSGGTSLSGEAGFEPLPEWRMETARKVSRRRSSDALASLRASTDQQPLRRQASVGVLDEDGCLQRIMMQPSSTTHLVWFCLGLALILYDVVSIPLEFFEPGYTTFNAILCWIIRVFWTLDIGRAFVTGRIGPNGELEMRFRKVAVLYGKSWRLPVDLLTVVGDWAILFMPDSGSATLTGLWLTRSVRIVRLLRVAKINEIENFIGEYIHTESGALVVHMLKMMLVLVATAHIIACIWYKVGTSTGDGDMPAGWVVAQGLLDADLSERYAMAFHWSLAQFTGENVYPPQNKAERSFAICVLLLTFVLSALFVSSVTTSMTRLTIVAGKQPLQLVALRRFLFDQRISTSLFVRMQRNAQQALLDQKRAAPELLAKISEPLRTEFHFELHSPALLMHPFILYYHETNPACVRSICHVAISTLQLLSGDVVFSENETPAHPRMLFVSGGAGVLAYHSNGEEPFLLTGERWICEAALWTTWVHCGTLVSEARCKILALDAERFRTIMSRIPTRDACKYAASFLQKLNALERSQLSDLWLPDYEDVITEALPMARYVLRWSSRRGAVPIADGSPTHAWSGGAHGLKQIWESEGEGEGSGDAPEHHGSQSSLE